MLGLLRKYRYELNELSSSGGGGGAGKKGHSEEIHLIKIAELEQLKIEDDLIKMRLTDERARLARKLEILRHKYNELVNSKSNLQAELIHAEEEKLQVS